MNVLYAITDTHLMPGDKLYAGVRAALDGGCRMIQYRDKSNSQQQRVVQASRLVELCNEYRARLIINDDVQLAHHVGAHGVHLGQEDGSPLLAREKLGKNATIGVTCHASLELARQAIKDSVDYVAFGRFFTSQTKPEAPPAPLSLLQQARQELGMTPIVAIGGITLENAQSLLNVGATMIAVSFNLFGTKDIKQQAQKFCLLHLPIGG